MERAIVTNGDLRSDTALFPNYFGRLVINVPAAISANISTNNDDVDDDDNDKNCNDQRRRQVENSGRTEGASRTHGERGARAFNEMTILATWCYGSVG